MNLEELAKSAKNKIHFFAKAFIDKPDKFEFVDKDDSGDYILPNPTQKVMEVGEIESHVYPHEIYSTDHVVSCHMTNLRYFDDLDVNAVHVRRIERVDNYFERVDFQPLRIIQ